MRRGEVWWAELGPPAGRRPILLISRDEAYSVRTLATVAPITTRVRGIPAEVALGPSDGLPRLCVANMDSLTTISQSAVQQRVTVLSEPKMREVDVAIHFALGLNH